MKIKQSETLYLFTATFPFGRGETYLKAEIDILSVYFDKIYLVPLNRANVQVYLLPENVEILHFPQLNDKLSYRDEWFVFKNVLYEAWDSGKWAYFTHYRKMRAILKKAILMANTFESKPNNKTYFYSFWMNEWALMLSILKMKGKVPSFVFRVNGYDIYDFRSPLGFIPFRYLIFKNTNAIFPVSENAAKYLKERFGFRSKIKTAYFGTEDYGKCNPMTQNELRIFSCARLIPLKNCTQIARVLASMKINIKWHHHGEGPQLNLIKDIVSTFPENVHFSHSFFTDNHSEAIQVQKKFNPDVFLSLSKNEGLPVTMIEALSLGVPIISTNVGGCIELVNSNTGILLSEAPTDTEISEALIQINQIKWRTSEKRNFIKNYWKLNFSANARYCDFAVKIKEYQQ